MVTRFFRIVLQSVFCLGNKNKSIYEKSLHEQTNKEKLEKETTLLLGKRSINTETTF